MIWSQYYQYSIISPFNYRLDCIFIRTPNYTTRKYNWRQIHQQKVKKIQIVQHSESQKMAYELTMGDGNKVLLYLTNVGVPTIIKKFDGTPSKGYTDIWKVQGKPIETTCLNVRDVQQGLKPDLKNNNYKLKNFENNKVKITEKQIGYLRQVGRILGGMLVEAYYGELDRNSLKENGIFCRYIPFLTNPIGTVRALIKKSHNNRLEVISIQKQPKIQAQTTLSRYVIPQLSIFIGTSIGTLGGPLECATGSIIGGIIGGAGAKLINMNLKNKFKLKITFSQIIKGSKEMDCWLIAGSIQMYSFQKWIKIKLKVQSFMLSQITEYCGQQQIYQMIKGLQMKKINQECFLQQFPYMGPFDHESKIAFYAFGVNDENHNENNVMEDINNNKLTIISSGFYLIKMKYYIKQVNDYLQFQIIHKIIFPIILLM